MLQFKYKCFRFLTGLKMSVLCLFMIAVFQTVWAETHGEPQPVKVMVFPGAFNWPIWAAQENGLYADEGLSVEVTFTRSSVEQISSLMAGTQDIGMTAVDNVIAYVEGVGEAELDQEPDLFVFMGGDHGFLSLITRPDITKVDQLRGEKLGVDAMTTGYAFVLQKLLRLNNLDDEVEYVSVGGALQRFQSLMAGDIAGTLLMTPFDVLLKAQGHNQLIVAGDEIGDYQGVVGAARKSWAKQNEQQLVAFIRGYRAGLNWLYDPNNKQAALDILAEKMPNLNADALAGIYAILLNPDDGLEPGANVNMAGIRTVIEIRNEFCESCDLPLAPEKYYDGRYFEHASSD